MANVALLRKVRQQIEKHPETWDQSVYFSECGTKACVAGWAALLTGGKRVDVGSGTSLYLEAQPDDPATHVLTWHGQRLVSVDDRAARLLGIDDDTAEELFNGDNTIEDVRNIMDEIEAEASVTA